MAEVFRFAAERSGKGPDVAHYPIINAFAEMAKRGPVRTVVAGGSDQKQVGVLQLINAHRFLGTRWAQLDPLKRTERPEIHELELSHYGFTEADLNQSFNTGSFHGLPTDHATLREILDAVRQTYCGSIGAEYMYMTDIAEKRWIQAVSSRPAVVRSSRQSTSVASLSA
jgi:2-oxoglutarate dehydrogenase E1 component